MNDTIAADKSQKFKVVIRKQEMYLLGFYFQGHYKNCCITDPKHRAASVFPLLFNLLNVLPTPDNWAQSANVSCFHFDLKSE